ncbi:hypothetical protein [Chitinophaga sp. LS1]|uniref:hypothetical protein n=1 Tax=Chitinophaga sp. LS1 TaxID=3051176 RepID=UPI002AAB1854|nr:hypothetical protein [Chitinophaga sp. LS1]WPV66099.1 hypothetical protein QQL36_30330 [Chitinophaga sp. LS1]
MKFILSLIILLILVVGCKKDTPSSSGEYPQDSLTFISKVLYYQGGDTTLIPDTFSIHYNGNYQIDKIIQTDKSLWTFTYNTKGAIATVKGGRYYLDYYLEYYFNYNTAGRLDSLLINAAFGSDSMLSSTVFTYDANSHIKSAYSYVVDGGGSSTGFYTSDSLATATYFSNTDLDSLHFKTFSYSHDFTTDPPTEDFITVPYSVRFNTGTGTDISTLDKTLLFWLSIRSQPFGPLSIFDLFWYQYINPDVSIVKGGSFNSVVYHFSATKNADGGVTGLSVADVGNGYSTVVKIAYTKILK